MGVSASIIPGRPDKHAESFYRVNSIAEAEVNCHAICAASIQPEDRDGESACMRIEISSRFQIRSRIPNTDGPCGGPGFRKDQELCEIECVGIIDIDLDETDEWRWTVEHPSREIVQLRSRGRYGSLSCRATERCQHKESRQYGNPFKFPIRLVLHCCCNSVIESFVLLRLNFCRFPLPEPAQDSRTPGYLEQLRIFRAAKSAANPIA